MGWVRVRERGMRVRVLPLFLFLPRFLLVVVLLVLLVPLVLVLDRPYLL